VGCAKRLNALNFSVVQRILMAWFLTLPAAGLAGYCIARVFMAAGPN
jgi:phosphate/sulfate permease